MDAEERRTLDALCVRELGRAPDRVQAFSVAPGGEERRTWRLRLGPRIVYATRRTDPRVTEREAAILRALARHDAPVPDVLTYDGGWLLQASAGEPRLSELLDTLDPVAAEALLRRAIESLARIHVAGRAAEWAKRIPAYAQGDGTARALLATLEAVARTSGLSLPSFDRDGFLYAVASPGDDFIKWDARPANAALGEDGEVRWFDWQHANRRHRSDDLIWLLSDPTVPDGVDAVGMLFQAAGSWGADLDRVAAMAVAHLGTRLHGCLMGPTGLDASWEDCVANDWLGSRESVRRLARRGVVVARRAPHTAPLADWFEELARASTR